MRGYGVILKAACTVFVLSAIAGCGQSPETATGQDVVVVAPEAPTSATTSTTTTTADPPVTSKASKAGKGEQAADEIGDAPLKSPKASAAPGTAGAPSTTVVTTATTCPPETATAEGYARAIDCRGKSDFLKAYSERIKPERRACFLAAFDGVPEQEIAEAFASQQIPPAALAAMTESCAT